MYVFNTVKPILNRLLWPIKQPPCKVASNPSSIKDFSIVFNFIKQQAHFKWPLDHFPKGGCLIGVELYAHQLHTLSYNGIRK